jgi:hypothetical protein
VDGAFAGYAASPLEAHFAVSMLKPAEHAVLAQAVEGKKGIAREMSHGEQNLKFSWERFIVCS